VIVERVYEQDNFLFGHVNGHVAADIAQRSRPVRVQMSPTLTDSSVDRHLAAEAARFASVPGSEGRFQPATLRSADRVRLVLAT
jgi:hypothetical protein